MVSSAEILKVDRNNPEEKESSHMKFTYGCRLSLGSEAYYKIFAVIAACHVYVPSKFLLNHFHAHAFRYCYGCTIITFESLGTIVVVPKWTHHNYTLLLIHM